MLMRVHQCVRDWGSRGGRDKQPNQLSAYASVVLPFWVYRTHMCSCPTPPIPRPTFPAPPRCPSSTTRVALEADKRSLADKAARLAAQLAEAGKALEAARKGEAAARRWGAGGGAHCHQRHTHGARASSASSMTAGSCCVNPVLLVGAPMPSAR